MFWITWVGVSSARISLTSSTIHGLTFLKTSRPKPTYEQASSDSPCLCRSSRCRKTISRLPYKDSAPRETGGGGGTRTRCALDVTITKWSTVRYCLIAVSVAPPHGVVVDGSATRRFRSTTRGIRRALCIDASLNRSVAYEIQLARAPLYIIW